MPNFQDKVGFIWDIADLLRGPYKRSEYQDVILPFTVLKRFDCVLSDTKGEVLLKYEQFKDKFENKDHLLKSATSGLSFYNYSKYDFDSLLKDPEHIEENILHYLDCFSQNVFNDSLMNDAVYKFKCYEDASLEYTGINRHAGEAIGLFDTVIRREDLKNN